MLTTPDDEHRPPLRNMRGPVAGWMVGFGIALATLGLMMIAHLLFAGMVSTFVIGAVMLIGGMLQLGHALAMRSAGPRIGWEAGAAFYLAAAMVLLFEPVAGTERLLLLFALLLGLSGVGRLWTGAHLPGRWLVGSGTTAITIAVAIVIDWRTNPLWLLGGLVALDLAVLGAMMILSGLIMRHREG